MKQVITVQQVHLVLNNTLALLEHTSQTLVQQVQINAYLHLQATILQILVQQFVILR